MKNILIAFISIIMAVLIPITSISQGNDTYISETAYEACVEYGEEYGICPEPLMAIIERESAGKPNVENGSCKGLMQISVKWHSDRMERLGVKDIFDERSNILVGTDYLAELIDKYRDVATALMAYFSVEMDGDKATITDRIGDNMKVRYNREEKKVEVME